MEETKERINELAVKMKVSNFWQLKESTRLISEVYGTTAKDLTFVSSGFQNQRRKRVG